MTNTTQQQQLVSFVETTPSTMQVFESIGDPTFRSDSMANASLAKFLERPVLIDTWRWVESTPFAYTSLAPWHAFFTHPIIKKKIDNYGFINCNLHVKAIINASPFYSGAMIVSYRPLTTFGLNPAVGTLDSDFVTLSQRPHFFVMPQNNQGGELTLPFFYHKNWLNLTNTTELTQMGRLDIYEYVPLANANGVTGAGIDIQFYAWATDVDLTGPTYELQSGKPVRTKKKKVKRQIAASTTSTSEYEQGPVEKVASTVASIATKLGDVPVIGPFAKATEYGAKALAGISSLFGWTNVPVIEDVSPLKSLPFHAFSSCEIGVPVDKLTLDPKNELTIDPRTVGLQGCDELSIPYIVSRESWLTNITWSETQASGDMLFISRVNPIQLRTDSLASQTKISRTPMALVASQFTYWRGDIIYRIKAVCTQYHKGRLRVTWDPLTNLNTNSDTTETSFTKILDLAPDLDVEIRVSYLQSRAFLSTRTPDAEQFQTSTFNMTSSSSFDNGSLSIRILNDLTGPAANASVSLMIFVRGDEDLQFMGPTEPWVDKRKRVSYFSVQSGNVVSMDDNKESTDDSLYPTIFGGESVKSLRNLMRRTVRSSVAPLYPDLALTTPTSAVVTYSFAKLPDPLGYTTTAETQATGLVSGVPEYYSWGVTTPFTDILPCFVGYRGSMMYHFNISTNSEEISTVYINREPYQIPNSSGRLDVIQVASTTGTSQNALTAFVNGNLPSGSAGSSLMNQRTQTGISVLIPNYLPYRMCDTNPATWLVGSGVDDTLYQHNSMKIVMSPIVNNNYGRSGYIEKFYSIGPDFNAFFFLNVPPVYLYASEPVAA